MRVLTTNLRVEIENEMRVDLESLNFEIEMRVSQKSARFGENLPETCDFRNFSYRVGATTQSF